jgi:hypothetical protein
MRDWMERQQSWIYLTCILACYEAGLAELLTAKLLTKAGKQLVFLAGA